MNPPGTFKDGKRLREFSTKDMQALSGKLIPEFDRRRNIRDMFQRKPSVPIAQSEESALLGETNSFEVAPSEVESTVSGNEDASMMLSFESTQSQMSQASGNITKSEKDTTPVLTQSNWTQQQSPGLDEPVKLERATTNTTTKRSSNDTSSGRSFKRSKSGSTTSPASAAGKSQQSLKGFFKPRSPAQACSERTLIHQTTKPIAPSTPTATAAERASADLISVQLSSSIPSGPFVPSERAAAVPTKASRQANGKDSIAPLASSQTTPKETALASQEHEEEFVDPIVSKESWGRLFTKRPPPRCEGHDEPCMNLITKKSGMNCGRAFWMCSR